MKPDRPLYRFVTGILIALMIGMISCSESPQAPLSMKAGEGRAPDFILKDLSGGKFMLSEQRGKPVLIIFSTTWCPTCRSEIPHYKKIHDAYAGRGLVMVNVDIGESREKVSRFRDKYRLPYPVLLDEKSLVSGAYQIVGVPTLILIDRNGILVSRDYEAIDGLLETAVKS